MLLFPLKQRQESSRFGALLKDSFFAVPGDVFDVESYFGGVGFRWRAGGLGIGSKQFFTHCGFNFSCGFRVIYSRAPTHLTPGQLKIPPPLLHLSPLEKQEACRSQTQQRPCDCAARIHCRCFLTTSLPPLSRLYICLPLSSSASFGAEVVLS